MLRCHFALTGVVAAALIVGCGSVSSNPDGGGGGAGGKAGTTGSGGTAGTTGSGGTGNNVCTFAATYVIKDGGGLVPMADTVTLSPPASFHFDRDFFRQDDAGRLSCDPPMPACGDPSRIDSQDVELALNHPDVQTALAMTTVPFYGNRGVADGPNFNFMRGDRGFNAGLNCDAPSTTCTPIPAGVNALVQLLRDLIRQQRMDPSCAAIVN